MSIVQEARSADALVGERIHLIMWQSKVTQSALANRIGLDQSGLGRRLRGERGWAVDTLIATARELNTTVAYLVGEIDDPKCTPSDLNREPTVSVSLGSDSDRGDRLAPVISIDTAPRFRVVAA